MGFVSPHALVYLLMGNGLALFRVLRIEDGDSKLYAAVPYSFGKKNGFPKKRTVDANEALPSNAIFIRLHPSKQVARISDFREYSQWAFVADIGRLSEVERRFQNP